jgi:hypothetical protein
MEPTGQVYSDQTGKFVQPSSHGNNYLFILYDYDSNLILAEPMKTRSAQSILGAYKTVHTKLCRSGLKPQLQRLDNECSDALKEFMTDENIDSISCHLALIAATLLSAPFAPSKITSSLACAALTRTFPSTCGIAWWTKLSSPSTYCEDHA